MSAEPSPARASRPVLFVQGAGAGVHDEWDRALVDSLRRDLGPGYHVRYPRMPGEADPDYERWKAALDAAFRDLRDDAILVGHSVGGTILVRMLAQRSTARRFGAIFLLAAPFLGAGGWAVDDVNFTSALGASLPRDTPVHLFHGLDDDVVPPSHVDLYARAIPQARVHRLPGRDHQLNGDLADVAAAIAALDDEPIV